MNGLDFVVMAILLLSLLLGLWRGLVLEVMVLIGWPVAFVLSKLFAGSLARLLPIKEAEARIAVSYALIFIVVLVVWSILARLLSKLMKALGSGWLDKLMGGVFGLVRGALILLVLTWLAGLTHFSEQPFWRDAKISKTLEKAAALTRSWLPDDVVQRIQYPIHG